MVFEGRIIACIGCVVGVALGSDVRAQDVEPNLLSQSELNQEIGVDIESLEGGSEPVVSDETDGTSEPDFFERFNLPPQGKDYKPTRALRCDVVRHLKTPSTYRRLDSYMKPQAILPEAKDSDVMGRGYATGAMGWIKA